MLNTNKSWLHFAMLLALIGGLVCTPAAAGQAAPAAQIQAGPSGTAYQFVKTFGVTEMPYFADTQHIRPFGLTADSGGNVYIVEEQGARLLKMNAAGTNLWVKGKAGVNAWSDQDPNTFGWPRAVTLDNSGNVWVADNDHVEEFTSAGVFVQNFPAQPWNAASQDRFNNLMGIAFDTAGHLYVADSQNNRIVAYTLNGSGVPVFAASLGTAGSGLGQFNWPNKIAIDAADNSLFVADTNNNRVQKCTPAAATWPWGWNCAVFHGGLTGGSGANQLAAPQAVRVDASRNVFIADTSNDRIKKCTPAGVCQVLVQYTNWPTDITLTTSGDVLVPDFNHAVVRKFSAAGAAEGIYSGIENQPYLTDTQHYLQPQGIAFDKAGYLYVAENAGQRVLKIDPSNGNTVLVLGTAGVSGGTPDYLCWPRAVAVGPDGRIYVVGCNDVRVFGADGVFIKSIPSPTGNNDYFNGIAVDASSRVYLTDANQNKVFVLAANNALVHTFGTGTAGSGNDQLNFPAELSFDAGGNLYIADSRNCRVQKFDLNWQYAATFGASGTCAGDTYTALGHVSSVAVDSLGRVFTADFWDNHAQVLDSSGRYLTTLASGWGTRNEQVRGASSVAVDPHGNVYLADWTNGRIQMFSPVPAGWRQANLNGFLDPGNGSVTALEVFRGYLYAGRGGNWNEPRGAAVMRTSDGSNWELASQINFGTSTFMPVITDLAVFKDSLYATTGWGNDSSGAQLWRSSDGTHWSVVGSSSFGNGGAAMLGPMIATSIFGTDYLYLGCNDNSKGTILYRSATGNPGDWQAVTSAGLGNAADNRLTGFAELNGGLYASVESTQNTRASVWYTPGGTSWSEVGPANFGVAGNTQVGSLAAFNGHIYAGSLNESSGAQLFRLDGTSWTALMQNGFGDNNNYKIEGLFTWQNKLVAKVNNNIAGMSLWSSPDGTNWTRISLPGFGNSNNNSSMWNTANAVFNQKLFIGTWNGANGGQVWRYDGLQTYVPMVRK